MPREQYTQSAALETDNVGLMMAHLDTPQLTRLAMCLAVYLASVFDQVAQHSTVYVTIGGTRQRDAFLVTEKGEAGNTYAGGENIVALLEQVRDKLLTAEQAALAERLMTPPPPRKK